MPQFSRTRSRKITIPGQPGRISATRARMFASRPNPNDVTVKFSGLLSDNSKQLSDPFNYQLEAAGAFRIVPPAYPFWQLVRAGKQNSILNQCIEAYVVNIESYGYQLEYIGPQGQETSDEAQAQKNLAISFLDHPSPDRSLRQMREESRKDLEYTGNRYFEIGEDQTGVPTFMEHVPSTTMRMSIRDDTPTDYEVVVKDPSGNGFTKRKVAKRFRRYVQMGNNGEKVFFKEFGDPRPIDPTTGEVNATLAPEDRATAIYHHSLYAPGFEYGVPRWIGALPAILGIRESEMVNLNFFKDNAIPAMAVLISGGALTAESFETIQNMMQGVRGKDSMNRILVLEAASDDSVGTTDTQAPPVPKIEMKPMVSERQQDGLFKDFEDGGKQKVRSSMRLPAIYTGDSEEYTKATAQSGMRVAESQVFAPERTFFDEFVNLRMLPLFGVSMWKFKSTGPTSYDPTDLSIVLGNFAKNGALTPNILVRIANQILDVQIQPITEKWGDIPFAYTLAMVNAGAQLKGFEDVFAVIADASAGGTPPAQGDGHGTATPTDLPANKALALTRAQLRKELNLITNDIINHINDGQNYVPEPAANVRSKEAA